MYSFPELSLIDLNSCSGMGAVYLKLVILIEFIEQSNKENNTFTLFM